MTKDKTIPIRNIYYMLAYAFQALQQRSYDKVAAEDFENMQELYAAILSLGVARQLKQGLYRTYVQRQDNLSVLRGKLGFSETIRQRIQRRPLLACEFDELQADNIYNQILKTALVELLQDTRVSKGRKSELKKQLLFFGDIQTITPAAIPWRSLTYMKDNKSYELLLNICRFVLEEHLLTTEQGARRTPVFSDESMHKLFECFILEYYKKHHLDWLNKVNADKVPWHLTAPVSDEQMRLLPEMQTDAVLHRGNQALIIDAKYYSHVLQQGQHSKSTAHSANLYQILAYVKNMDKENTGRVAGALVYAKTDEDIDLNCRYEIGGNSIFVRTLDLNREFSEICEQLDRLALDFFGQEGLVSSENASQAAG